MSQGVIREKTRLLSTTPGSQRRFKSTTAADFVMYILSSRLLNRLQSDLLCLYMVAGHGTKYFFEACFNIKAKGRVQVPYTYMLAGDPLNAQSAFMYIWSVD